MRKLLLLIIPVLAFMLVGCAEEENAENTTSNGATPEQLKVVDDAFYNEYKKQVADAPADGKFSVNVETNIKLFMQNITGRGMMPPTAGIGEVSEKNVASAMGKQVVEDFKKSKEVNVSALTKYAELDVDANKFLPKVVSAIMGGTQGKKTLASLQLYQSNQKAIEKLVDSHVTRFGAQKVNANGYVNFAYFYSYLTNYFGMLKISALPTDDKKVSEITKVVYDHCNGKDKNLNTIETWNGDTTQFTPKVMEILTCGTKNPFGQEMTDFMNNLGKVFDPNFSYNPPVIPPRPPRP